MFYHRYALAITLATDRINGSVQQQYLADNPDAFRAIPPTATLSANRSGQMVQLPDAALRAPYLLQPAVMFEHQISASNTPATSLRRPPACCS